MTELHAVTPADTAALPGVAPNDAGAGAGGVRVWKVPARVQGFTGREGLLAELADVFGESPVVVRAIEGMGGVGKSSAVIEYAHRHAAGYEVVWWIAAENSDLIAQQVAELGQALRVTEPGEPVAAVVPRVWGALRERERVLVVFDNAEHPSALAPYLPGGRVQVVITSRYPFWTGVAVPVPIDVFTAEESARFLAAKAPRLTAGEITEVAERLGHLPSALDQAAALLCDGTFTPAGYLELLESRGRELLHRGVTVAATGDAPIPVAASWMVAFDALQPHDPAAVQLLTLLAWLAPEPVPLTLITSHPDLLPEPLATTAADRHDLLTTHHDTLISLLNSISDYLYTSGQPRQALSHAQHAHRLAHHHHGPDHTTTLGTGTHLANRLSAVGEHQAARELDEDTLTRRRRVLGDDHPNTLGTSSNLAIRLAALGENQAARELQEDTLTRYRRILGDDHPDTLRTARNLVAVLRELNQADALQAWIDNATNP